MIHKYNTIFQFRFCKAMNQLELILKGNGMEFVYHESYGYLLTCPSGIGTALRAGAHMNLRRLTKVTICLFLVIFMEMFDIR